MNSPLLVEDNRLGRLTGTVKDAVAEFPPDIVHDNGLWRAHNHWLARICREKRIPRLVSTRGMLEPWARRHKKWKKDFAWLAYQYNDLKLANGIHATAAPEAENLSKINLGVPVHVISNGVDLPAVPDHRDSPTGVRTALFLGRLYPVKGLPLLIEAWNKARPRGWRLVVAGPDEAGHRAELERMITRQGLGDIVTFIGAIDGPQKTAALLSADLFVLPSHSESFGMAVAEALAHGLPVLTTTAVPWPVLSEKGFGWRTAVSVEGIARGLAEATSMDKAELRRIGERGRNFVSTGFGWNMIADQFLATYAATIAKTIGPWV